jgi:hypothetical protein
MLPWRPSVYVVSSTSSRVRTFAAGLTFQSYHSSLRTNSSGMPAVSGWSSALTRTVAWRIAGFSGCPSETAPTSPRYHGLTSCSLTVPADQPV